MSGAQPNERLRLARRGIERSHGRLRHLRVVDPVHHDERPRCYESRVAFRFQLAERAHRQPRGGPPQRARSEREVGGEHVVQITGTVHEHHVAEPLVDRRGDYREGNGERGGRDGDAIAVYIGAAGEVRRAEREERRHLLGRLAQPPAVDQRIREVDLEGERSGIVEREHDDIAEVAREVVDGPAVELPAIVQENRGIAGVCGARLHTVSGTQQQARRDEPRVAPHPDAVHGIAPAHPDEGRFREHERATPVAILFELVPQLLRRR